MFMIFSYLPLFKLRLTKGIVVFIISLHVIFSFASLSHGPIFFIVHGYRSGHMQAFKIYFS